MKMTAWGGRLRGRSEWIAPLRRRAVALIAAMVAVGAPALVAGAQYANPAGVALIIGNMDYEHRDVPDVTYAHRDADAFRHYVSEVLGYAPENVISLRDATRRGALRRARHAQRPP